MSESTTSVNPGTTVLWDRTHHHHDVISTRSFGFWLYMLSDAMIFASLFVAFAVLDHRFNAAGGPLIGNVVHPGTAFFETFLLFTSVLAYGGAMVAVKQANRSAAQFWIVASLVLALVFLGVDLSDFSTLAAHGITPQRSGMLSIYFALMGYHALHIIAGALWMLVMLFQVGRKGFNENVLYRLINLRWFWHFQAVVWVCLFVFVDLKGVIA